jgi:hypothetical protein
LVGCATEPVASAGNIAPGGCGVAGSGDPRGAPRSEINHTIRRASGIGSSACDDPKRYQDYVIDVAEHWNHVRDQVDRRESVTRDEQSQRLGIPRRPGIARHQVDGVDVSAG